MRDRSGKYRQDHNLRSEIAYQAARLIADGGATDFAIAKHKAARQMCVTDQDLLPNNQEIDAALRLQQSIFQGNSQPEECRVLREVAVDAMRWLDRFSPWLVGAVLSGTANRFSQIELEIVADDGKLVEVFFVNERAPFDTKGKRGLRSRAEHSLNNIVIYEISYNETSVAITLYPDHALRFAHHPRASLKHSRARLAEVELLLAP